MYSNAGAFSIVQPMSQLCPTDMAFFFNRSIIIHSGEINILYLLTAAGCHNGLTLRQIHGIFPLEQKEECSLGAHFPASSVIRWKVGQCRARGDGSGQQA